MKEYAIMKKLDFKTLQQAIVLRDEIFPSLGTIDKATLNASLNKKEYAHIYAGANLDRLNYWLHFDEADEVVGIVGLYTHKNEINNQVWLGWFGVKNTHRGQKIGSKLLDFAIEKASLDGYKELHLYTIDDLAHKDAIALYLRRGFSKYKKYKDSKTLYFKKDLSLK